MKNVTEYEIKKVACKGVPTTYAYDFIIDGMASFLKPMRMKEALIRVNAEVNKDKGDEFLKEVGENVWNDIDKYMKSIYIKRTGDSITYPVNVNDIPELEKNSKTDKLSIKKELKKDGITIKKKSHKNNFTNTVVPTGYFNRKGNKARNPRLFISQKVHYFRREQCIELKKGDIWFRGDVLHIRTDSQGGQYYHIFITNYKGIKLNAHFWGGITLKFFKGYGLTENLLNKHLVIKLANDYIENGSLELLISFSASKMKGQIETEKIDMKTDLSEKQLKTLLAFKEKQNDRRNVSM